MEGLRPCVWMKKSCKDMDPTHGSKEISECLAERARPGLQYMSIYIATETITVASSNFLINIAAV